MPPYKDDPEILRAALLGFQHSLGVIEQRIAELRSRLGGHTASGSLPAEGATARGGKRTLSASARRRIAMAQKKRWAEFKAANGKPEASATPAAKTKRKLSAEGRARIVAATKKRWAAFRKKQQAAKAPSAKSASGKTPSAKGPAAKSGARKAAPRRAARKAPQVSVPVSTETASPATE